MKVACFTVATMDYFPQQRRHFPGGNALNQAVRFSDLGLESAFIGAVGTDSAGDTIQSLFEKRHVDTSHMYRLPGATANNQLVNDESGERFGVEGTWTGGVYDEFTMSDDDWDYIANFELWSTHADGKHYETALERKSTSNFLVVDFLHFNTYELLLKGRDTVDIAYFGGVPEQQKELEKLSRDFPGLIALTLGAKGSIAIRDGETFYQPALPIDKVVDTTGCGDAFQSGFTARYIASRNIQKSLMQGAEMGRKAAMNYGGIQ